MAVDVQGDCWGGVSYSAAYREDVEPRRYELGTWVWRRPCKVQSIFNASIAAAKSWLSRLGERNSPFHLAKTGQSSAARPMPKASRCSSWRARCERWSAASHGEIVTLRRPFLVLGDFTRTEPFVCSSERSIRTTFF